MSSPSVYPLPSLTTLHSFVWTTVAHKASHRSAFLVTYMECQIISGWWKMTFNIITSNVGPNLNLHTPVQVEHSKHAIAKLSYAIDCWFYFWWLSRPALNRHQLHWAHGQVGSSGQFRDPFRTPLFSSAYFCDASWKILTRSALPALQETRSSASLTVIQTNIALV